MSTKSKRGRFVV
ncbi:unnamed protein product, partial [Didymodactylos carnosus]